MEKWHQVHKIIRKKQLILKIKTGISKYVWIRLKLDLHNCSSQNIAIALSCDDISIDQFLFFFSLHSQHVITHISSRVAIIVLRLIILTNCLKISYSLSHGEQINVEGAGFFRKMSQNNGQITGRRKQALGCVQKKVEKLQMHIQRKLF